MTMIGKTIEAKGKVGFWGYFFLMLGVFLLVAGLSRWNTGLILWSSAPLILGLVLWLTREKPLCFDIESEGLLIHHPQAAIPFSDIKGVRVLGKATARQFPIEVTHAFGKLVIPSAIPAGSRCLYRFLSEAAGLPTGEALPKGLDEYRVRQGAKFGEEKILVCQLSNALINKGRRPRVWMSWFSLVLIGAIWCYFGQEQQGKLNTMFTLWGVIFVVVGFVIGKFMLAGVTIQLRHLPKPGGLVVSPVGFALIDGPLQGELKWGEVQGMKLRRASGFDKDLYRIDVSVAGSTIQLRDIYQFTVQEIYQQMETMWGHEGGKGT